MFFNEIEWTKFLNSTKKSENSEKFVEKIRIVLNEDTMGQNLDEVLFEIDEILSKLTEDEQNEVKNMINQVLNEIEPYQKAMKKAHPPYKKKMLTQGLNNGKSAPFNTVVSTKNGKSGI